MQFIRKLQIYCEKRTWECKVDLPSAELGSRYEGIKQTVFKSCFWKEKAGLPVIWNFSVKFRKVAAVCSDSHQKFRELVSC